MAGTTTMTLMSGHCLLFRDLCRCTCGIGLTKIRNECDDLDGLSESHFVGQNTTQAWVVQGVVHGVLEGESVLIICLFESMT